MTVRRHAKWMVQFDERILETLAESGPYKLHPLHMELAEKGKGLDYPIEYLLHRCQQLKRNELISQQSGEYYITQYGSAYLEGDIDAENFSYDIQSFHSEDEVA